MKTLTLTLKPGTPESVIEWLRRHPDVESVAVSDRDLEADGWIPNTGVAPESDLVQVRLYNGSTSSPDGSAPAYWNWNVHAGISHWRPVKSKSDPLEADGWIPWQEGDPIPTGIVFIRETYEDGEEWVSDSPAKDWTWPSFITHYKPCKP